MPTDERGGAISFCHKSRRAAYGITKDDTKLNQPAARYRSTEPCEDVFPSCCRPLPRADLYSQRTLLLLLTFKPAELIRGLFRARGGPFFDAGRRPDRP